MNGIGILESGKTAKAEFLELLNELHIRSGLSLREVAIACDLDPTYVHYILKGARKPQRDVIIALGFAYGLDRLEVDEILLLARLPPIGRGSLREYRKANLGTNGIEPSTSRF
jgi:transcriptional regulator with XRE-family HTH domain